MSSMVWLETVSHLVLDKPSDIGDVFGIQNKFNGLGIMLDTFKTGNVDNSPCKFDAWRWKRHVQ